MGRFNLDRPTSRTGLKISASNDQVADMIRKKAYELYEKRGKKTGRSMDDWLEAERIMKKKAL